MFLYSTAETAEEMEEIVVKEKTIEPWTSSLNNIPEKFIEKEKSYHEKSLQRILFQEVERYVIILMYL